MRLWMQESKGFGSVTEKERSKKNHKISKWPAFATLQDEICSPMIPEEQYAAIINAGVC